MDLNPDWREFFESFEKHEVEFMVVGALALACHGHPRLTGDLDVWIRPTAHNASRVLVALQEFGVGSLTVSTNDLTSDDAVPQIGYPPRRIDLLTFATGVSFEDAWSRKVTMPFGTLNVPVIGKQDLIVNKRSTGRLQDLADAAALEGEANDGSNAD
ncbi:MAG TPA: hypothetical protein VNI20_04540 [Fimbriimonadaceae bacterium]|nr:hypothetical protein [Fimbriimonadaceae bacterium]